MNPLAEALRNRSGPLLAELEGIYKDLHQHPELSMQEVRTGQRGAHHRVAAGGHQGKHHPGRGHDQAERAHV
ncbi:hypothetical protein [[Acidovorax] ebreus]|uniref:hypothetical protein n=1 Tax=Diaphorobacter sp. LI3 TaxID=2952886 RepID=UPI002067ED1B|nr:hypothetical protein MRB47_03940 [Diaphorobacter sp. LI3]